MKLKPDHRSRPIWIAPDAHIHLEAHSPVYAREFLIAIAEPLCRPEFIHEHQITAYSLYAAVSIGLVTNDIIEYLERLSKTTLPDGIKEFIKLCTLSYGKVKLVLKQNRYFIECRHSEIVQKLLNDSVIQAALVDENTRTNIDNQVDKMANMTTTLLNTAPEQTVTTEPPADEEVPKDFADFYTNVIDNHDEDNDADALRNLQILSFEIKQEHLEIVQRKCIELEYPLLAEYDLVLLYEESMRYISNHEWVLLLFGEVHTIPAKMFRRVLTIVQSHCKLGLTTTLVIDDDKDTDLNFLIGPKLYEANKMELQTDGHIAEVQCADVRCAMTGEFFAYYLTLNISRRLLLAVMNPNKMRTCQFLVEYHKARGHKIIIFSDNVGALKRYAMEMKIPFLYGETSQMIILQNFQYNPKVSTILVSKVANTSFDLPEANVLIQVSSHGASRRQKAQRLGRTLLAKKNTNDEFNAYFYSLVSSDTIEMTYSRKRQQFLNNQGYSYKIVVVMVQ